MSIISKFNSKLMVLESFFKQATKSKNVDKVVLSQQINKLHNNSNITPFCQEYFQNTDFMSIKPRGESVKYHGYLNAINHHLINGGNLKSLETPLTGLGIDISPKELIKITDFQFKLLPKTTEPIIAYRCIGEKPEFFKADYARYVRSLEVKKGDIVTMPEYAYSTSDINYAKCYLPNGKGIIYEIEYPVGSRISVTGHGANNEITAPRCSRYECLDITQQGEATKIKLKYIKPMEYIT